MHRAHEQPRSDFLFTPHACFDEFSVIICGCPADWRYGVAHPVTLPASDAGVQNGPRGSGIRNGFGYWSGATRATRARQHRDGLYTGPPRPAGGAPGPPFRLPNHPPSRLAAAAGCLLRAAAAHACYVSSRRIPSGMSQHWQPDDYTQAEVDYSGGSDVSRRRKRGGKSSKAAKAAQMKRWRAKNQARYRGYQRRWMAQKRAAAAFERAAARS